MRITSKGLIYYILFFIIVGILSPNKCVATGVRSHIACEGGMVFINCPHNTVVITIAEASYGRELSKKYVCQSENPDLVIKDCGVSNVKTRVQDKCEGKSECSFTADNRNLGYFCTNVYKYLIVLYDCVPRPSTDKPTTAIPTTLSQSTFKDTTPTLSITTRIIKDTTTAFTNFTMHNFTSFNETTTNRPETRQPLGGLGQVIPLTLKPAIDAYDRDIFKTNHGTSSTFVSGSLVSSSLVAILLDVFLLSVT